MVKSPAEPGALYEAARQAVAALSPSDGEHILSELAVPGNLHAGLDLGILALAHAEAAQIASQPSIDDVRRALAVIPGSLSDDIIAERGDY